MIFFIYHHNDFDGIASAALFAKFLQLTEKIELNQISFIPADYNIKDYWPRKNLEKPNAVIDFLYHHDTTWWFDHHSDPFSTICAIKRPYVRTDKQYWNPTFFSCPSLMTSHFYRFNRKVSIYFKKNYKSLIEWSDIIDGARYNSPSDLYGFENVYMNINKTLALSQSQEYLFQIIKSIFSNDYSLISEHPLYKELIKLSKSQEEVAIKKISELIEVDGKVAFFDQSDFDFPFQRYLAYHLFPDIYYRIGIFKRGSKFSVSVNYNNWINKENRINLGKLCKIFGGGGRFNVGGILTDNHSDALRISQHIKDRLKGSFSIQLGLF